MQPTQEVTPASGKKVPRWQLAKLESENLPEQHLGRGLATLLSNLGYQNQGLQINKMLIIYVWQYVAGGCVGMIWLGTAMGIIMQ